MRKYKFVLLTVCILLVGALTAGLAARAVVAPRTGETISAGVLSVPSVLGQTAEEVLFYPWPMYDPQTLFPLPEDFWVYELEAADSYSSPLSNLLGAFQVLGASYDQAVLLESLVWNLGDGDTFTHASGQLFLKDFPTTLCEGQTPVTLNFAFSENPTHSISYLVRPAQPVGSTPEQQDAALEKVRADLLGYLRSLGREETVDPLEIALSSESVNELAALLDGFLIYYWEHPDMEELNQLYFLRDLLQSPFFYSANSNLSQASLEDLLAALEGLGCTVQLISTPQQVVILFTANTGSVFGIYYDIQLERYSGLGMSF